MNSEDKLQNNRIGSLTVGEKSTLKHVLRVGVWSLQKPPPVESPVMSLVAMGLVVVDASGCDFSVAADRVVPARKLVI